MPLYKSATERNVAVTDLDFSSRSFSAYNDKIVKVDGKDFLLTNKEPMSKVVEGLTHSQGSIALISVMCAGFAFQGFTVQDFDYHSLSEYHKIVYICKDEIVN